MRNFQNEAEYHMRPLAFSFAILISAPGMVSAQSVLERVLGEIDGATNLTQVNGTYANIAESIALSMTETNTVYEQGGTTYTEAEYNALLAAEQAAAAAAAATVAGSAVTFTFQDRDGLGPAGAGYYVGDPTAANADLSPTGTWYDTLADAVTAAGISTEIVLVAEVVNPTTLTYTYKVDGTGTAYSSPADAIASVTDPLQTNLIRAFEASFSVTTTEEQTGTIATVIDGSITNVITGVTSATQEAVASLADATEWQMPTFDLGDMATTVLGAVNTGEIALGVNSAVDEAATSTTNAISAAMTQIGGSADTGALVLNVAHNASIVNGSIENVLTTVNGSIGALSTTTLGAVNTGTIVSGLDAAVQGIVGRSGQPAD